MLQEKEEQRDIENMRQVRAPTVQAVGSNTAAVAAAVAAAVVAAVVAAAPVDIWTIVELCSNTSRYTQGNTEESNFPDSFLRRRNILCISDKRNSSNCFEYLF